MRSAGSVATLALLAVAVLALVYPCAAQTTLAQQEAPAADRPASETVATPRKSPLAAGAMSWFVPGMGQFYNGEHTKAAAHLGTAIAGGVMLATQLDGDAGPVAVAGLAVIVGVKLWSPIDAFLSARRVNRETQAAARPELRAGLALARGGGGLARLTLRF